MKDILRQLTLLCWFRSIKDLPEGWTLEELEEFERCGYVSFQSEEEVLDWCEMAFEECMKQVEAAEAAARAAKRRSRPGRAPDTTE